LGIYKIKLIGELFKMKNTYNKFEKNCNEKVNMQYAYYSKVLSKPFDSLDELREAEEVYYEAQRAKELKAVTKKNDAIKVETAFKALNTARKTYKDELTALTVNYSESLKKLKSGFESDKAAVHDKLAAAEAAYEAALKEFTEKYPEGYHLTLKDGDFETTISSKTSKSDVAKAVDLFDLLFRI
jgi:hypothetical protein